MLRSLFVSAVTVVTVFAAGAALFAQGVITEIKTPPLAASDTFVLPMAIHPTGQPPWAGWAGGIMTMHILDNTELNVLGIGPAPGMNGPVQTNPFGPASNNSQSVTKPFTAWVPTPPLSGINITPSQNLPLFTLNIHVKNSTGVNSDVDATFGFWNIWHIRDNPVGSTLVHLDQSDYILVRSSIQDPQQLHTPQSLYQFPTNPANPETGHWLHIIEPITFHLVGGPGSQYYATFLNVATLGIDHIPEPSGIVLLVAGVACTGVGAWFRRRRTKSAA